MITKIKSNIFNSDCQILVNPTNSVGVMGAGLAKVFKEKYPKECNNFNEMSINYQTYNRSQQLLHPFLYYAEDKKIIMMFPTKIHWKHPSKYTFIRNNLIYIHRYIVENCDRLDKKYPSIAFPAIGCGLGGLEEKKVLDILSKVFYDYGSLIEFYQT